MSFSPSNSSSSSSDNRCDAAPGKDYEGQTREYFVTAEEVEWDYAPLGFDASKNKAFSDDELVFVGNVDEKDACAVVSVYKKARYIAYTDATYSKKAPHAEHLGALGPEFRALVGDTIVIHFKNLCSFPVSMHPHGVAYTKAHEGAKTNDGGAKEDDAIAPGASYTYVWPADKSSGPVPADGSSVVWAYHSHVDTPADTVSGLVGSIVIVSPKCGDPTTCRPLDVNREFTVTYFVYDENAGHLLDDNIATFCPAFTGDAEELKGDDEDFDESNLMHAMNGYVYGSLPGLNMVEGETIRWYLIGYGTEVDLHTPHWHGNTLLVHGERADTVELLPLTFVHGTMYDVENVGAWLTHCHVNDHIAAGMSSVYTVVGRAEYDTLRAAGKTDKEAFDALLPKYRDAVQA